MTAEIPKPTVTYTCEWPEVTINGHWSFWWLCGVAPSPTEGT